MAAVDVLLTSQGAGNTIIVLMRGRNVFIEEVSLRLSNDFVRGSLRARLLCRNLVIYS